MDEFSEKERRRIDELYKNELKDMTPDDFALYTRWIIYTTKCETEADMINNAQVEYFKAKAEEARIGAKLAQAEFEKLLDEKQAKWSKGVGNGEAK